MFQSKLKTKKGFTLLELLAVVAILAIIVGIAGPAIFKQLTKGKVSAAVVSIDSVKKSLNTFFLDCGFFPSTEQGLQALIEQPGVGRKCKNYDPDGYLEKKSAPLDPWSSELIYTSPGQNNPSSFDLSSPGPDGTPGTDDDINSWE